MAEQMHNICQTQKITGHVAAVGQNPQTSQYSKTNKKRLKYETLDELVKGRYSELLFGA